MVLNRAWLSKKTTRPADELWFFEYSPTTSHWDSCFIQSVPWHTKRRNLAGAFSVTNIFLMEAFFSFLSTLIPPAVLMSANSMAILSKIMFGSEGFFQTPKNTNQYRSHIDTIRFDYFTSDSQDLTVCRLCQRSSIKVQQNVNEILGKSVFSFSLPTSYSPTDSRNGLKKDVEEKALQNSFSGGRRKDCC